MFGKNPKRPPELCDGSKLAVQEIFRTLQGEGPNTGMPAIFLRLGGCNLACNFCDTEFEEFKYLPISKIIQNIESLSRNLYNEKIVSLIVITGGEPFRQEINPVCQKLLAIGYQVQIETNGTIYRTIPDEVEIVCSPKVTSGRYHKLRDDILAKTKALKFIISATIPEYSAVPDVGQNKFSTEIFVQPMDEYDEKKNTQNQELALKLALQYGYRLSLQTHKILKID